MNPNGIPRVSFSNPRHTSSSPPAGRLVPLYPKLTDGFKTSSPIGSGIVTTDPTKWSNLADWPDGCETSDDDCDSVPELGSDSDDDCDSVATEESGEWDDLVGPECITSPEELVQLQNHIIRSIHKFEVDPDSPPHDDIVANPTTVTNSLTPSCPSARLFGTTAGSPFPSRRFS